MTLANIVQGSAVAADADSSATIDADGGGIGEDGSIVVGADQDGGMYSKSDHLYIENKTEDGDIIFRVNDGGTFKEVGRVWTDADFGAQFKFCYIILRIFQMFSVMGVNI